MHIKTKSSFESADFSVSIDKYPNVCPMCHHSIKPQLITSLGDKPYNKLDICFHCNNCDHLFLSRYRIKKGGNIYSAYYEKSEPKYIIKETFSDEITNLSDNFVLTYNQAKEAESYNLNMISGIGYRKSLEFLIKDYLIYKDPANESSIKNSFLGKCIELIDNQNLKTAASRATWIGNDEAHYIRKWEDKDVEDLKILIKIATNFIENELLIIKYTKEMPE
jgi:hypothetical protein